MGGQVRGFVRTRQMAIDTACKVVPRAENRLRRSKLNPNRYRWATGGAWDTIGPLQLDYLVAQGLRPEHHLLDVGCGGLRGGIHFVRYLDAGHYCGIDRNQNFLDGGKRELEAAGLAGRGATLLQDDQFHFSRFGRTFDYAVATSVFTHLPFNTIMRCLGEIEPALNPGGRFFATFFFNPGPRLRVDDLQSKYHITHLDRDPFFYDPDMFRWAVEGSTLRSEYVGDWGHPRGQEMLVFTKAS